MTEQWNRVKVVSCFNVNRQIPKFEIQVDYVELNRYVDKKTNSIPVALRSSLVFISVAVLGIMMLLFLGHWIIPIFVAMAVWLVAQPGVFTPDSIWQIWQADTGVFDNWHPSIMAISLNHLFEVGISIQLVMMFQCMFGTLSIHWLICEIVGWCNTHKDTGKLSDRKTLASLVTFIFLLSPLTPFSGFLIVFWKDAWFAFACMAAMAAILHLSGQCKRSKTPLYLKLLQFIPIAGLMTLSVLVRHNAVLMIPAFLAICFLIFEDQKLWLRIVLSLLLLIPLLFSNHFIAKLYNVTDKYPKGSVMATEMAGLLYIRPDLESEFPYVSSQIEENFRNRFEWADHQNMKWGEESYASQDLMRTGKNPKLVDAYFRAVVSHPGSMARVKIMNFVELLKPDNHTEWKIVGIAENDRGLETNAYAKGIRKAYEEAQNWILQVPLLRWISAVNLLWQLLGLTLLVVAAFQLIKRRMQLIHFAVLTLPMIYTLSYLMAAPWKAFRYLYPSTLMFQIIVLSLAVIAALQKIERRKSGG
jgi:hypothetical protein